MKDGPVPLVGDAPHLLSALPRQLADRFDLLTASTGNEAIKTAREGRENHQNYNQKPKR